MVTSAGMPAAPSCASSCLIEWDVLYGLYCPCLGTILVRGHPGLETILVHGCVGRSITYLDCCVGGAGDEPVLQQVEAADGTGMAQQCHHRPRRVGPDVPHLHTARKKMITCIHAVQNTRTHKHRCLSVKHSRYVSDTDVSQRSKHRQNTTLEW